MAGSSWGGAKAMITPILFLSQRTLLPTCCEFPHGYFTGGQDGFITCGIEFGLPVAKSCKSSCRRAKVFVLDVFTVGLGPSWFSGLVSRRISSMIGWAHG